MGGIVLRIRDGGAGPFNGAYGMNIVTEIKW